MEALEFEMEALVLQLAVEGRLSVFMAFGSFLFLKEGKLRVLTAKLGGRSGALIAFGMSLVGCATATGTLNSWEELRRVGAHWLVPG